MIFFGTQDALALHLAEFVGEGAAVDPQIICQLLAVKGDVELVVALFLCKKSAPMMGRRTENGIKKSACWRPFYCIFWAFA